MRPILLSACALAFALAPICAAQAHFHVLYTFHGGADGGQSAAGLFVDRDGTIYGSATIGGTACGTVGCGTIFKLAPDGTQSVVYAFQGGRDGEEPETTLIRDRQGNLYGTTVGGGHGCRGFGCGTVFALAPDGTQAQLHVFRNKSEGDSPNVRLLRDRSGNLYGTAFGGPNGFGIVYEVASGGSYSILYSFTGGADGAFPLGDLIEDAGGNLYGTTALGGANNYGDVFKLAPGGTLSVLYSFAANPDGRGPGAGLIADAQGDLYGTTFKGGTSDLGTVFKLAPGGTETVLHSFAGGEDGAFPNTDLIFDAAGNLYGTTYQGGPGNVGTVFKTAPDGTTTVIYAFTGGADGAYPFSGVTAGRRKKLYGTTWLGGDANACNGQGCGTVFEIHE